MLQWLDTTKQVIVVNSFDCLILFILSLSLSPWILRNPNSLIKYLTLNDRVMGGFYGDWWWWCVVVMCGVVWVGFVIKREKVSNILWSLSLSLFLLHNPNSFIRYLTLNCIVVGNIIGGWWWWCVLVCGIMWVRGRVWVRFHCRITCDRKWEGVD